MANVLICWELGLGSGHCAMLLPFARGLAERGHRVTAAVLDLATARNVFRGVDAELWQAPPAPVGMPYALPRMNSYPQMLFNVGFGDADDLGRGVRKWRALIDRAEPDLIIFEHAPTALVASRWSRAKRVVTGHGFMIPPDKEPMPIRAQGDEAAQAIQDERHVLDHVNQTLRAGGLTEIDRIGRLFAEVDQTLLLTFRELDHYARQDGVEYHGVWPPHGGVSPEWPGGRGHPVLCYLKPSSEFPQVRSVLSALAATGARVLAVVPGFDEHLAEFDKPNVRIVSRYVDLDQAARQAAFAVTNGGFGTTATLLLRGTPMLVFPLNVEQMINGKLVERLGAGRVAHPGDPHRTVAAITAMFASPHHREAAEAFAARYADLDPDRVAERLVDRLEALLT